MKNIIYLLLLIIFSYSCSDPYRDKAEEALALSENNRTEIEKVMLHFQDDADPLKRLAAWFLIANMPYHAGFEGVHVESYDSAYIEMAGECLEKRDSAFKSMTEKMGLGYFESSADILTMKSEYLIKAINDACEMWHSSPWSREYDTLYFLNYVLPYRILDEPLSDWRGYLDSAFLGLRSHTVRSNRGVEKEAEDGSFQKRLLRTATSASKGSMVMLSNEGDSVAFVLDAPLTLRKHIMLRYTAAGKDTKCTVTLNGRNVTTLRLEPTKNMGTFRDTRTGFDVTLKKGSNRLVVSYSDGTIGLDKIRVCSVEPCSIDDIPDFSDSYCRISSKASREYISFDTSRASLLKPIRLKPLSEKDSSQLLRLNYLGYPNWNICSCRKDSTDLCVEVRYCLTDTAALMTPYHYTGGNHQKWVIMPVPGDAGYYRIMNKNSGLFLEARENVSTGQDSLVQMPYRASDAQMWKIEKAGRNPIPELFFRPGSAVSEALRITDVMSQFEFLNYSGNIPPKATSLLRGRTGRCRDEADYVVYLCRYLGIPSTVDFTPHWGNRSLSHSWSVLIKPDGTGTPFYMGCAPGDTAQYFHSYLKPKIFRHQFSLNEQIAQDLASEKSVPLLFDLPCYTDVTEEYYETTDVVRHVPATDTVHKVAYICVFDNRDWVPVFYGNVHQGKVTFASMGRRIMYMSAFYEDGRIVPFGDPFYITADGNVNDVKVQKGKTQSMRLLRKYPFMGKEDFFNLRMDRGRFEGSNDKDFAQTTVFHTHSGATNGNWYDIPVKDSASYRYLRYIGANGSHCNINELEFYDEEGSKLRGKIIGTEGEGWCPKERVFDGNILTGFGGLTPDGHWVGLRLRHPSRISRIRYIGRNDGNGIEKGDEYELYYWNEGKWMLLASEVATQNELNFKDMPVGGLYVLRNVSKGHEERIFTYVNGEQVWW